MHTEKPARWPSRVTPLTTRRQRYLDQAVRDVTNDTVRRQISDDADHHGVGMTEAIWRGVVAAIRIHFICEITRAPTGCDRRPRGA